MHGYCATHWIADPDQCLNSLAMSMNAFPDPYNVNFVDVRKSADAGDVPVDVTAAYGLEDATYERLTTGSYNIHFKVESEHGDFDLRRSNRPIDRSNLRYEAEFLLHLRGKGFRHAPNLVLTSDDKPNYWLGSNGWTLFEWIDEVSEEPDFIVTDKRIDSAAKTLAEIHLATADFSPESRRGDWPIFSKPEEWTERWAERSNDLADHLGPEGRDLRELSQRATEQMSKVDFNSLHQYGCHGDYRVKNVRFTGDQVSTVFDFDTAMISTRLFDLGGAVTRFSPMAPKTGSVSVPQADVESGGRFLRAYNDAFPLSEYEWEVLPTFTNWRLIRDVTAYFDQWWTKVGNTSRALSAGTAEAIVESAR